MRQLELKSPIKWFAAALVLALAVSAAGLAQSEHVTLSFVKEDPDGDGTWNGTVSGPLQGEVATILLGADQSSPVWSVAFEGRVSAGEQSLRTHVGGTLDTTTGVVRMAGVVTEGHLLGAAVDWQGQLVDAEASRFEGTITLTAAASGSRAARDVVLAYVDALNAHDFDAFAETIGEHMVSHGLFGMEQPIRGRDAYVAVTAGNFAAFPDARIEVEEMIAEGNLVALRWTVSGTNTEAMGETPATGMPVIVDALALFRVENGRIVEKRYRQDDFGMFQQLGLIE